MPDSSTTVFFTANSGAANFTTTLGGDISTKGDETPSGAQQGVSVLERHREPLPVGRGFNEQGQCLVEIAAGFGNSRARRDDGVSVPRKARPNPVDDRRNRVGLAGSDEDARGIRQLPAHVHGDVTRDLDELVRQLRRARCALGRQLPQRRGDQSGRQHLSISDPPNDR